MERRINKGEKGRLIKILMNHKDLESSKNESEGQSAWEQCQTRNSGRRIGRGAPHVMWELEPK